MMSSDKGFLELFIGHKSGLLGEKHKPTFYKHVANNPKATFSLMTKSPDFVNLVNEKTNQQELTSALNARSKETLKDVNAFDEDVVSLDKKIIFSPFKFFLCSYLLDGVSADVEQPLSNQERGKLNFACDLGSYDALTIRCLINCKNVETNKLKNISCKYLIEEILKDLDHLSNIYGFMGYIKATQIHLMLSQIYLDAKDSELALAHKTDALKSFLCAVLIFENPKFHHESVQMMNKICEGEPLVLTIDDQKIPWKEVKPLLLGLISSEDKVILEKRSIDEIASLINPSANSTSTIKIG